MKFNIFFLLRNVQLIFLIIFFSLESPAPVQQQQEQNVIATTNEEENSVNLIQTYISTNQISENKSSINGIFESEARDEFDGDVVIGDTAIIENTSHRPDDDEKTFKKPFVVSQQAVNINAIGKLHRNNNENISNANAIGKPTREIISCFMTTSGFISPAREGKFPEAKKPIIIPSDEPPEEIIEVREKSPKSELNPVKSTNHSLPVRKEKKQDSTSDATVNEIDNQSSHVDRSCVDESGNDKEVKLYEVIQTVPLNQQPQTKKKTKKSQLQADAQPIKESKKQKKIKALQGNQGGVKGKKNLNAIGVSLKESNEKLPSILTNPFSLDQLSKDDGFGADLLHNDDKLKKKLHKLESLKKKHKKERQLGAMPYPPNNNPELQEKQRKKRISKLSKKNLTAMGLNPNTIEGFAIPAMNDQQHSQQDLRDSFNAMLKPIDDNIKMEPMIQQKESQKKMKQMQKLSNEPDKQKIKFFKKLQSTSSSLLSKSSEDINRSTLTASPQPMQNFNLDNNKIHDNYGNMQWHTEQRWNDDAPPNKKAKLQKKLNRPPKELKPPKIKKVKEGKSPVKKPRAQKIPKTAINDVIQSQSVPSVVPLPKMTKSPSNIDTMPMPYLAATQHPFFPGMDSLNPFPGAGLIASNPLFQSFNFSPHDQKPNYPFPGLQGYDFSNFARFKRPNFGDSTHNDIMENVSKHPMMPLDAHTTKSLCNVASLMPPSLLNIDFNNLHQKVGTFMLMNEQHSSKQKIHQDNNNPSHVSFNPKKSSTSVALAGTSTTGASSLFSNQQQSTSAHESHVELDINSPIVIDSEDDIIDKHISSRSPSQDDNQETSFSQGDEIKRKKVKDKSSKEGKKEKKDKETGVVKIKKKKDKKDKSKNKLKHGEHSKPQKDKSALKKEKREKKKEKERSAAALAMETNESFCDSGQPANVSISSQSHSEWSRDAFIKDQQIGENSVSMDFNAENSSMETSAIPKLTLKLAPSSSSPSSRTSRPSTPDFPVTQRKRYISNIQILNAPINFYI